MISGISFKYWYGLVSACLVITATVFLLEFLPDRDLTEVVWAYISLAISGYVAILILLKEGTLLYSNFWKFVRIACIGILVGF